jgi:hypothetical protein
VSAAAPDMYEPAVAAEAAAVAFWKRFTRSCRAVAWALTRSKSRASFVRAVLAAAARLILPPPPPPLPVPPPRSRSFWTFRPRCSRTSTCASYWASSSALDRL